jgi:dihydrofolate reductase
VSKIKVYNHLTLDGVMQAPGSPDEDRRGGFAHGGWHAPYDDPVLLGAATEGIGETGTLLLGRWTYEKFAAVWPNQPEDNPFTAVMNNYRKYVASRTLREPLEWNNSTLLDGDAADAVAELRARPGDDIVILGSGVLIRSLMRRNLIDEFVLPIHPLVLGSGRRLFADEGAFAALRLADARPTPTGVVIATYHPAGPTDPSPASMSTGSEGR